MRMTKVVVDKIKVFKNYKRKIHHPFVFFNVSFENINFNKIMYVIFT